ncbi:MAG: glycosyltransferase family 4 protein [Caldisericia bacterium]|jgi:glycosyltransferase involved in cell wall biosynthesis|nr:glycosyltransferase family 4 protein [Caldisericia bacterium]
MKKIGIFISGGEKGGSRYQVMSIAKELRKEFEFVFFNFYKGVLFNEIKESGFRQYLFKEILNFKEIGKVVEDERLDLIHTYGFRGNFYGRVISKKLNIKSISSYTSFMNEDYSTKIKGLFFEKIDDLTLKVAELIIVPSNSLKEYILNRGYKKEIKLINLGIELNDNFYKKEDFGLKKSDFVIGTVMRLERVKNPLFLIEIFSLISKEIKNAKLIIVGDGSLRKDVERRIEKLNLSKNVLLLGFRSDVRKIYGIFDVFVLPSIKEGFSIVTLEAMSSSLPVITFDSLGVRDIVEDGINGFIIKKLNKEDFVGKILYFLDEDKRKEFGERNRKKVSEKFTKENMIEKTFNVYKEVIR